MRNDEKKLGDDQKPEDDQKPVFLLLQQIKDGSVDPEVLTQDQRIRCVDTLLDEGASVVSMAQLLRKSERTIKRDLRFVIRQRQDMADPSFSDDVARDIWVHAKIHRQQLMKLSRSREASTSEKVYAEASASRVVIDAATKIQSLGFLRSAPQAIVGEIMHRAGSPESEASFSEMKAVIIDVINTAKETNTLTPELLREAEALNQKIEKAEISSGITGLLEKSPKKEE